ncbi:hypothetical protein DL770_009916 [Monosporascus sp. CRB-9-2]|nr:hypothetical protein DL770_009916 [Monosporascus sp. CRB-9-2]
MIPPSSIFALRSSICPVLKESLESLAAHITKFGFEVMLCTPCFSAGTKCRIIENISRCGECVEHRRRCDGSSVPIDSLRRIGEEKDRLDRKEAVAEETLLRLQGELKEDLSQKQSAINETISLLRLRKQEKFLHDKGVHIIRRGLQSLDELKEQEKAEAEGATLAQVTGVADWPGIENTNSRISTM